MKLSLQTQGDTMEFQKNGNFQALKYDKRQILQKAGCPWFYVETRVGYFRFKCSRGTTKEKEFFLRQRESSFRLGVVTFAFMETWRQQLGARSPKVGKEKYLLKLHVKFTEKNVYN